MLPADWISRQKGARVQVLLRTGKIYSGVLLDFDANANLVLDELYFHNKNEFLGKSILNGATIVCISAK